MSALWAAGISTASWRRLREPLTTAPAERFVPSGYRASSHARPSGLRSPVPTRKSFRRPIGTSRRELKAAPAADRLCGLADSDGVAHVAPERGDGRRRWERAGRSRCPRPDGWRAFVGAEGAGNRGVAPAQRVGGAITPRGVRIDGEGRRLQGSQRCRPHRAT